MTGLADKRQTTVGRTSLGHSRAVAAGAATRMTVTGRQETTGRQRAAVPYLLRHLAGPPHPSR